MLAVATVILYLGVLITVGVVKSRRVSDEAGFVLAGRSLGVPVLVGTLLATWTGTGSIYGIAEEAYLEGLPALVLTLAPALGLFVMVVLSTRVRAEGRFTLQDLLEERFGPAARVLGTLTLVMAYVVIVSYQLRAGAGLLERLAQSSGLAAPTVDLHAWMLVGVALFIASYTALAGLMSVAVTDFFNGLLMTVGVLAALLWTWSAAGGVDAVLAALPAGADRVSGRYSGLELGSILLPSFLLLIGDANLHQRFLAAKSDRAARTAALLLIPGVVLVDGAILLLAVGGRALLPDLDVPGHVVLELGLQALPAALGALLVATILAVIVSTADSFLLSSASALLRDVYQRFVHRDADERTLLRAARVLVVLLSGAALGLAFGSERFFEVARFAYTLYGVGITPVLLAALFWRRATPAGAVTAMLTAVTTALLWHNLDGGAWAVAALDLPAGTRVDAVLPAVGVACLALVGVSLVTRPRAAAA